MNTNRSDPSQIATTAVLLQDVLRNASEKCGEEIRFVSGTERFSYREIEVQSDRLAKQLIVRGIQPRDRIILGLANSAAFIVACFAIWKARGVVVALDPAIRSTNLQSILERTQPSALIATKSLGDRVLEMSSVLPFFKAFFLKEGNSTSAEANQVSMVALQEALASDSPEVTLPSGARPDEVATITFTSGSTGLPKGVMHTHESTLACASFTLDFLKLSESDVMVIPLPLHHILAFRRYLTAFLARCTCLIASDIFVALAHFPELRPTGLVMVPAACNMLIDSFAPFFRENGGSLRYLEIGSEPMSPERLSALQSILPQANLLLTYGLTEGRVGYLKAGPNGVYNRVPSDNDGLHVKVIDSQGTLVAAGETGEILLQGSGLLKGYWGDSQENLDRIKRDGFRTGDMGLREANGDVQLMGRIDDILKVGGHKINPREVEAVLQRHPAIAEAVLVGLADPKKIMEARLHAFIVLRTETVPPDEELVAHCRKHLEPYKVPVSFQVRKSFPKTSVGKIQRHLVAQEARKQQAPD
ncbi:MAG TPA: class I adenylate-forming enzyme family protein [Verrucomicrobiae bacterium]|nr:class I adenylate-forming enzyme family protein [Verrucomicrobiae bacterium]